MPFRHALEVIIVTRNVRCQGGALQSNARLFTNHTNHSTRPRSRVLGHGHLGAAVAGGQGHKHAGHGVLVDGLCGHHVGGGGGPVVGQQGGEVGGVGSDLGADGADGGGVEAGGGAGVVGDELVAALAGLDDGGGGVVGGNGGGGGLGGGSLGGGSSLSSLCLFVEVDYGCWQAAAGEDRPCLGRAMCVHPCSDGAVQAVNEATPHTGAVPTLP